MCASCEFDRLSGRYTRSILTFQPCVTYSDSSITRAFVLSVCCADVGAVSVCAVRAVAVRLEQASWLYNLTVILLCFYPL